MAKETRVPARKPMHGTTADLGERREIRIMPGHAVTYPRIGDRRALIAPGTPGGKVRRPEDCRAFAVVEFAGRTCVKVHAGTDDYAQAKSIAQAAASKVRAWLMREITHTASRNGSVIGKAIPAVKIVDRTGLYPGVKRVRKAKPASDDKPVSLITRKRLSDDELTQRQHAIDRRDNRACRHCGEFNGANETCGTLRTVKTETAPVATAKTLAEAMEATAALRGE
jgi:hypothetical protein